MAPVGGPRGIGSPRLRSQGRRKRVFRAAGRRIGLGWSGGCGRRVWG